MALSPPLPSTPPIGLCVSAEASAEGLISRSLFTIAESARLSPNGPSPPPAPAAARSPAVRARPPGARPRPPRSPSRRGLERARGGPWARGGAPRRPEHGSFSPVVMWEPADRGAQPPRPPEMTSESFASHCLYLPGPAGSLPRRPLGQRVGGALPGDLHGQTGSPGMEAFGGAQEPRPKGPMESSRGDSRRGLSHSLPQPLHARLGRIAGGFPSSYRGGLSACGVRTETPQPLPANPPSPPPPPPQQQHHHHHHHTHKKIGYILNKAIRFLIRGLGCSV
ncbi:unnamed protein product [Pipistrellus nathusii]|uniref:Basic proline-rich protein-like n=1 Tax=Pipistrellus nathusii TaxID=59473 RepID=A0ABN9ZYQ5_PIPNA